MAIVTKPKTAAEKTTHSTVDTIGFTVEEAHKWHVPADIQRGVKVNKKVIELAEVIRNDGGVIPGILTFAVLDGKRFLLDGLQRREAFFMSGKETGYADARTCYMQTRADMAREFVQLNSHLVKMTADDVLHGLEAAVPLLRKIRVACPFVGYGRVRASIEGQGRIMLSMSVAVRCWAASRRDCPAHTGTAAVLLAEELDELEVDNLIKFLTLASNAWGRDEAYYRLWSAVNVTMSMWLYRRLVVAPFNPSGRIVKFSGELFQKCLMSLSSDRTYLDWLVGRMSGNRDRSPAYNRIKSIFSRRIVEETGKKSVLPQPEWAH